MVDHITKLEMLTSQMDAKEKETLRNDSIEAIRSLGYRKYDDMIVAIMSVSILEMTDKYKIRVKEELEKIIAQEMEKSLPEFLSTLTEGVDFVRVEKA